MKHFPPAAACLICSLAASMAGAQEEQPSESAPVGGGVGETFAGGRQRSAILYEEFFARPHETAQPITIDGRLQFRYVYTNRNREDFEHTSGFQFRRVRLGVEGAVTEDIEYSVEGSFGRSDGDFELTDATILFKLSDDANFKMGRFRPAFYREEMVSSKRQLLADRTLLQSAFGLPRTFGVQLDWEGEWLRAAAGFADQTGDIQPDEDYVYTARVEALLAGRWKYLNSFSAAPDQKLGILLGAGLLYLDNNLRDDEEPRDELFGDVWRWTADIQLVYQGWSAFAAIVGSQGAEDEDGDGVNQYGFLIQGGYRMDENWEVAARYEYGDADQLAKDLAIITLGVNYYFADHALKWQSDIGFALNEVNGFWSSTSRGWLTDRAGNDGQIVVRTQIQLLF